MYPHKNNPYYGIFVKEQIDTIKHKYGAILENEVFFINGKASKANYLRCIFQIRKTIQKFKPDLIHIHYGLSGIFLLFRFLFKFPACIITLHGGDINSNRKENGFIRQVTYQIIRRVKTIIVLNQDMEEQLKKYHPKLLRIACGVNTELFKPSTIKMKYYKDRELDSCTINIGFPGSKSRGVKNYTLFSKIIHLLQEKGYIVNEIEFVNMSRDQININLNSIDLLLMTSISEGSPQMIKEAMACNCPIVSTNVGDVGYLLKDVKNCCVVDSFFEHDFIEKIENILSQNKIERVSNGRERLMSLELDADSVANKIFNAYEKAILKE